MQFLLLLHVAFTNTRISSSLCMGGVPNQCIVFTCGGGSDLLVEREGYSAWRWGSWKRGCPDVV